MQQLRNNLYNAIEKPLNEAKAKYINGIKSKAGSFAKEMARLGIKPGSKESAAVQWIGEGQRQGPDGEIIEYTLADLQQQFPNKWQNIVEASQICRNIYDTYVNEINDALKLVYPDVEARAAATMDKINARVAYNTNQAQIWLDKVAQLERRLSAAQAETHSAESMAAAKTADRVNRLSRTLIAAFEDTIDDILSLLRFESAWNETVTARSLISSVFWSGRQLRRYGFPLAHRSDLVTNATSISTAENKLREFIGDEIMTKLIDSIRTASSTAKELTLLQLIEHVVAANISGCDGAEFKTLLNSVARYLLNNIDSFPEFANSSAYAALKIVRYENKKDDSCYFFG